MAALLFYDVAFYFFPKHKRVKTRTTATTAIQPSSNSKNSIDKWTHKEKKKTVNGGSFNIVIPIRIKRNCHHSNNIPKIVTEHYWELMIKGGEEMGWF